MQSQRSYIAIDLKSFYASVECVERGLDPLDAFLVVADAERTEKTICLAVSPALKAFGTGGRPRLFEVVERVREVNARRGKRGSTQSDAELRRHPDWQLDYIVAKPRMAKYVSYSNRIYNIYRRYVSNEDIHVYSVDEVFIDITSYLPVYGVDAHEMAMVMIRAVLAETGITATAGIGTNLYLAKVAMDIVAKKMPPDSDGVRIAGLDEASYRRQLWGHLPLTDFWRVGRGLARKLRLAGLYTMGDIARCSIDNEEMLYKMFGINAELLIDHAWGWEPVEIHHIKAYRPSAHSLSSGQVLHSPYTFEMARVVAQEMADGVAYDLLEHRMAADQIVLTVGYDRESLTRPGIRDLYHGDVVLDWYRRPVPAHSHGTANLDEPTSLPSVIRNAVTALFDRLANPILLIRRLTIAVNHVVPEESAAKPRVVQHDLFGDYEEAQRRSEALAVSRRKERRLQESLMKLKQTYGKNVVLKGLNYAEGATQRERNHQIGGHRE